MDVYLKYHFSAFRTSYWYLGMVFNATDQLYNFDLVNQSNDFDKNIKIGHSIKTFIQLFRSEKPILKVLTKSNVIKFYDDCIMRVGNMYESTNQVNSWISGSGVSGENENFPPTIHYSLMFPSFDSDPCLYKIADVPLKDLNLSKYKYDFISWMIHRSIQELN